jgi:hypothetical protein
MMYVVKITLCGMIYVLSFMKIRAGVQAILRFYLRNFERL